METPVINRIMSDSSIEITKNSRGFTYSVKAYGQDVVDIATKVEDLKRQAESIIEEAAKDIAP